MNNPQATIVGEYNVGKSTLFCWLTSENALIGEQPGTTVDYREGIAKFGERQIKVVDTPGYTTTKDPSWRRVAKLLATTSGPVLWMLNANQALTVEHYAVLDQLRKLEKEIFVLLNSKRRLKEDELYAQEVFQLPVSQIISIAAGSRAGLNGIGELLSASLEPIPDQVQQPACCLAIIGKPNVGKSTLMNALSGFQRTVVSSEAGTTQDPVKFILNDKIAVVDTAGLAKSFSIAEQRLYQVPEVLSNVDVVAVVFSGLEGLSTQDLRLANLACKLNKPLIFVANKFDMIHDKHEIRHALAKKLETSFAQVKKNNLLCISAKHKLGTKKIPALVEKLFEVCSQRIEHRSLNKWLQDFQAVAKQLLIGGRTVKLKYLVQKTTNPVRFILFVNAIPPVHYQRYVKHALAKEFALESIPFELTFKKNLNPYAENLGKTGK